MDWEKIDWTALHRLRTAFLKGSAGGQDYWLNEQDLVSYDYTFAQRIGWKWDFVLNELTRRKWTPPTGEVMDWGCGSGIAGRAFLDHFGINTVRGLSLWDRSGMALQYAQRRARERFPGLPVRIDDALGTAFETLLLSHVLTELDDQQLGPLLEFAKKATAVLWVEPGTHEVSRRLSQLRDMLRDDFNVVAPCVHQGACGMLTKENSAHWCHHFASPPPAVFTDGNWARFAAVAGIDLRSLPLSFIVLDKRPVRAAPTGSVRIVGRARLYKAYALLLGCDKEGLQERRLTKRVLPEQFRAIKKGNSDALQVWKCEDQEIIKASPFEIPDVP